MQRSRVFWLACLLVTLAPTPQVSAQQYGPSWQNQFNNRIMPPINPNFGGGRYVAPQYVPPPPAYNPYNQVNPFTQQPTYPYVNMPPQVYVNPGVRQQPIPLNPNITCPGCAVGLQPPAATTTPQYRQPQTFNTYPSSGSTFNTGPSTPTPRNNNNTYKYNNNRPSWVPW